MALRSLALCDGYGGFELAFRQLRASHGLDVRTVARCERDAHAASVLVARMEEARLDPAPLWDDLESFDGRPWCGRVDLVTAGFPCQPFSTAGSRRGLDDHRWLWPAIATIIRDVRPRFVFLENVRGLIRHGLPSVLSDLAGLGFDAEWGLLTARAVGAPHRRERVWLVAYRDDGGFPAVPRQAGGAWSDDHRRSSDVGDADGFGRSEDAGGAPGDEGTDGWWPYRGHVAHRASEGVGYAGLARLQGWGDAEPGGQLTFAGAGGGMADPEGFGPGPEIGSETEDDRRRVGGPGGFGEGMADPSSVDAGEPQHEAGPVAWEGGAGSSRRDARWGSPYPPHRDDNDGWLTYIAEGGPEPLVRRSAHGRPEELVERLHLLGNGLVPGAAAAAFVELMSRLGFTDLTTL